MSTIAEKARKRGERDELRHRFRIGPPLGQRGHEAAEAQEAKAELLKTPLGQRAQRIQQGRNRMNTPISWDQAVELARERMKGEEK